MQEPLPKRRDPLILIDESLTDVAIATALRAVDYNTVASTEQFGAAALDPNIIQWLGLQGGLWVTADFDARRKHISVIKSTSIHILWVQRPKDGGFPKKAQLLLILYVLEPVIQVINKSRDTCYFLAKYSGERPKWEPLIVK